MANSILGMVLHIRRALFWGGLGSVMITQSFYVTNFHVLHSRFIWNGVQLSARNATKSHLLPHSLEKAL